MKPIFIALIAAATLIAMTSCSESCEPQAPADIQAHLNDIEGKWIVNEQSFIFDAQLFSCHWIKDTAYITKTAFGFDVLLIGRTGTDCNTVDSLFREGVEVHAQNDGRFLYEYPYTNTEWRFQFDVQIENNTLSENPLELVTLLTGYWGNNFEFELRRPN